MEKAKLDINPVFNHRKSVALLDTAEALVDRLDNLSVCLRHIEEKYARADVSKDAKQERLYETLRENVESARELTDTLKREKWRLGRRQMSVDLRMGELEEVRNHMKEDMSMMNMTVEDLSMRLIQLENALCESQELVEAAEAEAAAQTKRVLFLETTIDEMKTKESELTETIKQLRTPADVKTKQKYDDLNNKMECLILENHKLKEIIREHDSPEQTDNRSASACSRQSSTTSGDSFPRSTPSTPTTPGAPPKGPPLGYRDIDRNHEDLEIAYV